MKKNLFLVIGLMTLVMVGCEPNSPSDGNHKGHNYVDLGLSVKWATCNIGASTPENFGSHFAWGETSTKKVYTWETYKWSKGTEHLLTKYNTNEAHTDAKNPVVDNKIILDKEDDAAAVHWGGNWRTPTLEEWLELIEQCQWDWTIMNYTCGWKITASNGNSIFLPAAGIVSVDSIVGTGKNDNEQYYASYWSNSIAKDYPYAAWHLHCVTPSTTSLMDVRFYSRYYGRTIRPVCE